MAACKARSRQRAVPAQRRAARFGSGLLCLVALYCGFLSASLGASRIAMRLRYLRAHRHYPIYELDRFYCAWGSAAPEWASGFCAPLARIWGPEECAPPCHGEPPGTRLPINIHERLKEEARTLEAIDRRREDEDNPYIGLDVEERILTRELRDLERATAAHDMGAE